jgi:hypothetical protein
VARFIRPQFSLATLLIAMAWSAVAVWMNTTPYLLERWDHPSTSANVIHVDYSKSKNVTRPFGCGWPWTFAWASTFYRLSGSDRFRPYMWWNYGRLVGDAAAGVLLVAVLTWTSSLLLRRIGSRLRRGTEETKQ